MPVTTNNVTGIFFALDRQKMHNYSFIHLFICKYLNIYKYTHVSSFFS